MFNEGLKEKSEELEENIQSHIDFCKKANKCTDCVYRYSVHNFDFKDIFEDVKIKAILENPNYGKFILLDQYGFKEIDENIFKKLISFPRADFIFFISSSFINRFKEHPNIVKYIDTSKINFEDKKPNEIHRAIADYFRDLIPKEKEYYLHHFSIQKEKKGNYYGLIFGSNHTLGMEKFLKVCWKKDTFAGEASYNIDNNFEPGTLFADENPIKITDVKSEIEQKILKGEICDNISGFKYAMNKGCEPNIFTDIILDLEKRGKISRDENKNNSSTNIHKAKLYKINRL